MRKFLVVFSLDGHMLVFNCWKMLEPLFIYFFSFPAFSIATVIILLHFLFVSYVC